MISNSGPKPRLYLHIGMPRTGTTSVQHCLATHIDGHPEYELLYFKSFRDKEGYAHHNLVSEILTSPEGVVEKLVLEYGAARLEGNIRNSIISSEGIWEMLSVDNSFKKFSVFYSLLSQSFDVSVIACLRDPGEVIQSMHRHQAVFLAYKKSGLEYLSSYLHDSKFSIKNLLEAVNNFSEIQLLNYHPLVGKDIVTIMTGGLVRNEIGRGTPSPSENAGLLMAAFNNFNIDLPVHFKNVLCFDSRLISYVDEFIESTFVVPDEMRMWGCASNFYYEKEKFELNLADLLDEIGSLTKDCSLNKLTKFNQISQFIQQHLININYSKFLNNYKKYLTIIDLRNELALLRWTDAIFLRVTSIVGIEYLEFRDDLRKRIKYLMG